MFFFHEMMLVLNTVWVRIILLMGWRNKVWAHQHTFCCSCFRAFCLSSMHTFLTYRLDELEWTTLSFDNPILIPMIWHYWNHHHQLLSILSFVSLFVQMLSTCLDIILSIIVLVLKCWLFQEDARLMDMDQSFGLIYFHQHSPFIFNLPTIKSSHIVILMEVPCSLLRHCQGWNKPRSLVQVSN